MKKILLITLIASALNSISQNNAPVAVNDTFYVNYNDTFYIDGYYTSSMYANDTDPDSNNLFIDTAFYYNQGNFSFKTLFVGPTSAFIRIGFKPPLNYWGLDSAKYVLRDDGVPVKYDTAWIYFKVKYDHEHLDLNNIKARIGLFGLFMDKHNAIASFEVPKGSGKNTIFAANLWVSGKNQDSAYANCETFGAHFNSSIYPYPFFVSRGGPIMDSAYYDTTYTYQWDRLWKINNWDISYHQNNWSNTNYQAPEAIESWPAHGDTSKGQAFYLAPFVDNNSDGIYNPYDGDYPKIKGQQAVYYIYNDERALPGSSSQMSTEIHCMAYAYNCPSDSAINNTIFVDYTIYNRSNLTYDSTYVGMWTDFDIGNYSDDYVACDVARSTFYGYNGDAFDEDAMGIFGYGNHPPTQGVTFLKGVKQDNDGIDNPLTTNVAQAYAQNGIVYPGLGNGFGDGIPDNEHWGMEHFMYYSIGGGQFVGDGDPQNTQDYYNYLRGFWRNGTGQSVWGGNGNSASTGGTLPTKYLFPNNSDPLYYGTYGVAPTPSTWNEVTAGNLPGDRRGLGSTGPFTFEPDSSVEITLAFVFGRDYVDTTTGNLASIVVMQERVDSIRSYYLNNFTNTACGLAISVNETKENENPLVVYPNPFNNILTVKYQPKGNEATISIHNIIGKKMAEQKFTHSSIKINLTNLAKGIYFLSVHDGNSVITRKVIKN